MGTIRNKNPNQVYHGRITGTKNKTYRGVPIEEYKKAREVLDKESFERWVLTVTGKPRRKGTNHYVKQGNEHRGQAKIIRDVGDALRQEQYAHSETNLKLMYAQKEIEYLKNELIQERNRSRLSRLFNLKG